MNRIYELKKLLLNDPNDSFLKYAISIELYKLNDKKGALNNLKQLLEEDPNYLATYYQLGIWLKELNEVEECRLIINKGIAIAQQQKNHKTLRELKEVINQIDFEDEQ